MDKTIQKRLLRGVWVAIIIIAIVMALYWVTPLVYPFLFGWVIAYLLNPLVNILQKRARMPRWLAVTISLIVFLSAAIGIITVLITNIALEIGQLSELIQGQIQLWKDQVLEFVNSDWIQGIIDKLNTFYAENPQYQNTINNNLSSTAKTLADLGSAFVGGVLNTIVGIIASLPNMATLTIIALLAAFFISKDWHRLVTRISGWFPEVVKKATRTIWADLQKALFGYLRAQLILISITAIVVIVGLLILNVEYAITIGLLIGFVDLLPYLGVGAAMVPWILFTFIQGDVYLGIGLSILYGVILVARQLVEPKVLATSIGLEPLPLLISMFVGLKLFGVLGLIYGPGTLIIFGAFQRAGVFRDIYLYVKEGRAEK
ncbi:sporulation integral membrane protein YtvI [Paenibacillus sp. MBLB4367]|uniref:sporulation integral membrane protein YtvI n=1 Tax=Paenibacillus sp. MBLB4367 TaxID=3384767 RepID=UPI0039080922